VLEQQGIPSTVDAASLGVTLSFDLLAHDLQNDSCASVTFDSGETSLWLQGAIVNGVFTPFSQSAGLDEIQVPLAFGPVYTLVPLIGGAFKLDVSAANSKSQVNGAVRATDLKDRFVAPIAQKLNELKQSGDTSDALLNTFRTFDSGGSPEVCTPDGRWCGCDNGDGTFAAKSDGKIDICELATGALSPYLRPDVELLDADGNYNPNPNRDSANKNAWSVGLGFQVREVTP
jgi:hypothetical protein